MEQKEWRGMKVRAQASPAPSEQTWRREEERKQRDTNEKKQNEDKSK